MDGGKPAEQSSAEWQSVMLDVSEMSLPALAEASLDHPPTVGYDSALGQSIRRLADELTHPGEPIAGFNSAL